MAAEKGNVQTPKAFISYSWCSEEHIQWIIDIAERLVENGIDVILDQWDLKEGHDRYDFMEKMVKDPTVSKVLMFSDKKYKEKADAKESFAGRESELRELLLAISEDEP